MDCDECHGSEGTIPIFLLYDNQHSSESTIKQAKSTECDHGASAMSAVLYLLVKAKGREERLT